MTGMWRWATLVPMVGLVLGACGRMGFDGDIDAALAKAPGNFPDAQYRDSAGTFAIDSPPAPDDGPAACANFDLGSAMGMVATGDTRDGADSNRTCFGNGSPDLRYAWVAPAAGAYTIDTCDGPNTHLDTSLTVLDGSCGGSQLACNDDACGTWLSRVHVTLAAGQLVIIVVDGNHDEGKFALTIAQDQL